MIFSIITTGNKSAAIKSSFRINVSTEITDVPATIKIEKIA